MTEFSPGSYFKLENEELAVIAVLLHYLLATVYGARVPTAELRAAFREMLHVQHFLYSDSRAVFYGLRRVESLLGKNALITSHMKVEMPAWDCLNLGHAPWHNLWKPEETRTESVPELIDDAVHHVAALAGQYAAEFDAGWMLLHHFETSFDAGDPRRL